MLQPLPERIGILVEDESGRSSKDGPPAEFDLVIELSGSPSAVADVQPECGRRISSADGLFNAVLAPGRPDVAGNVHSAFDLFRRSKKRLGCASLDGTAFENGIGSGVLQLRKYARKRRLGAAVNDDAHGALVLVVLQQQYDRVSEVRVRELGPRDQELACSRFLRGSVLNGMNASRFAAA